MELWPAIHNKYFCFALECIKNSPKLCSFFSPIQPIFNSAALKNNWENFGITSKTKSTFFWKFFIPLLAGLFSATPFEKINKKTLILVFEANSALSRQIALFCRFFFENWKVISRIFCCTFLRIMNVTDHNLQLESCKD